MGRKRPSEWDVPPCRYHPNRQRDFQFERVSEARRSDHLRGLRIKQYLDAEPLNARRARSLLMEATHPRNLSSRRYTRQRRITLNGHLLMLVQHRKKPTWLVTLMPKGWLIPATELDKVEPRRLLEQLRHVLLRAGISQLTGWAYLVLDLEYIEHLDAYSFHVHGLATKGVAKLLKGLRNRRKFKWPPGAEGIPRRPVQVKKIRRGDEARVINYLLKSYIGRRVYLLGDDGGYVRTRQRTSIPEPRSAQLICWLGRWTVDDFVLPVKVYFGRQRLELYRRRQQ